MASNHIGQINRHVEILPSPGKGLGVFARVNIPANTLIMAESPILKLPIHTTIKPDEALIRSEIEKLSKAEREEFFSLSVSATIQNAPGVSRAFRIYACNCSSLGNKGEATRLGVYMNMTRMNHSCIPNTTAHNEGKNQERRLVYALRDIPVGSEITTDYLPDSPFITSKNRNEQLSLLWGFICDCSACQSDTDFGKASEKRRKRIVKLEWSLKDCNHPDLTLANQYNSDQLPDDLSELDPKGAPLPTGQKLTLEGKMKAAAKIGRLRQQEGFRRYPVVEAYIQAMAFLNNLTFDWLEKDPTAMDAAKSYVKLRDWEVLIEEHITICDPRTKKHWKKMKKIGKEARDDWAMVVRKKAHLVDKEWAKAHDLVLPA